MKAAVRILLSHATLGPLLAALFSATNGDTIGARRLISRADRQLATQAHQPRNAKLLAPAP